MHDARAIANFFIDRSSDQKLGLTVMTLLKVMYFAHGWYLARTSAPLIGQPFEAWQYGPVNRVVYEQFKGIGSKPIEKLAVSLNIETGQFEPTSYRFSSDTSKFLADIFDYYAKFHAFKLSDLTHEKGGPWDQVWSYAATRAVPGMIIPNEKIRQWFCENRSYWFVEHFNREPAPFNYRRGNRALRASYKGLHSLPQLLAGCDAEHSDIGRKANADVVTLAAPLAFERSTQVVDLSARRFPFGRERKAAYRIPFFFIERGMVKAYLLQPGKLTWYSDDELGMIATIAKTYLLDAEFYGQKSDIEFVVLQAPKKTKERAVVTHSLASLPLWSETRLASRLTLLSEGLDAAIAGGRIVARARRGSHPEPDMPLFD